VIIETKQFSFFLSLEGDPQIGMAGWTFGFSSYVEARRKEEGFGVEKGEGGF
jgi:hypothetical protein